MDPLLSELWGPSYILDDRSSCDTVYMVVPWYSINRLQNVQKCTLKLALHIDGRTLIYGLQETAELDSLGTQICRHLIRQCFNLIHDIGPTSVHVLFLP